MALTDKDFEKMRDALKESNDEIQNFHDRLSDVFDISKAINGQYNKIYKELRKNTEELRISKEAVIAYKKELASVEEQIKSNIEEIVKLEAHKQDIAADILAVEESLQAMQNQKNESIAKEAMLTEEINEIQHRILKNKGAIIANENAQAEILKQREAAEKRIEIVRRKMGELDSLAKAGSIDAQKKYNELLRSESSLEEYINNLKKKGSEYADAEEALKSREERLEHELWRKGMDRKDVRDEILELDREILRAADEHVQLTELQGDIETQITNSYQTKTELASKKYDLEKKISEETTKQNELTKEINKLQKQLNLWKLIQMAYERFVQLDAAAENFRKETGFSIDQMKQLRKDAEALNVQFADMGVSIEKVYASAKALTDVFGRTSLVTKEALQNVSLLSANLGVAEADSANVLAIFQGLGNATEQAAMNVIKVGAGISEKAGVPFSLVMKDIANASEQTTALIGANPSKLMKSAIAARALGTDLNKIVASQRKLLDFSSSINDELEASAMLGKNISFQKARQLAYEGDIEGAAKATLESVKAAGDFDKMSVYQREALAKASGMELKDLTKMMAVDKQREAIMNGTDEAKKATLKAQEAELENLKKIDDLNSEDLVKQNEKVLMQQKMQGVMTKLKNLMDSLTIAFADILEPIITPLMETLVPVLKFIAFILKNTIVPFFKFLTEPIRWIAEGMRSISEGTASWEKTIKFIKEQFKDIGTSTLTLLKIFGTGFMTMMFFGKGGPARFLELLGKPFAFVGGKMLNAVKKIPGVGTFGEKLGGLFGKKDVTEDAAKGMDKAGKAAKSAPAGDGIKKFLTNLAAGLKEMGSGKVLFGAANLLIAAIPLAVIAPIALMSSVLGLVGKPIELGLKFLAKGISHMGNTNVFKGALGIALVGASIIPFAFAMKMFSEVNWTSVGIGALALVGFTAAAFGLGALLSSGVGAALFTAGVIGIGALGLALVPFGIAALAAGAGIKMLGEGISESIDPIMRLAEIDLTKTAIGITAVGAALAAFGGGSAAAGLGSFVGKFLGGDPIEKMEKLAAVGDKLKVTADSITAISQAAAQFSAVNSFSDAIIKLSESLVTLSSSINKFDAGGIAKLSQISAATGTTTNTTTAAPATSGVETKLDELISLMKQGYIVATVDLDKMSGAIAKKAGT